jgi:hypothetical protein
MRFIRYFTSICNVILSTYCRSIHSRRREKFVEFSPFEFFQNEFIHEKLAIGYRAILREMSARDLRNEFDRLGSLLFLLFSSFSLPLSLSLSLSLSLFLSLLLAISLELPRKNFYSSTGGKLRPEWNTIETAEFYFTRYRDFFYRRPQPLFGSDGYFAMLGYFSREGTTSRWRNHSAVTSIRIAWNT